MAEPEMARLGFQTNERQSGRESEGIRTETIVPGMDLLFRAVHLQELIVLNDCHKTTLIPCSAD